MPDLVAPTARLHIAWLEAHEEWGPGAGARQFCG